MSVLQPKMFQELSERKAREGSPVLSVYLNLDVTDPLNRRSGYKVALDKMLKDIESQIEDESKLRHFREDAQWVQQRIEFHLPKGKSLLLFCDVSESFFVEEELPMPVANQVWFGITPYVRPLLEAAREYERYGVVLVDREKARFYVISMGKIEEVTDVFQDPPVKHRSTVGSDHMRSQMVLQRRAATWSNWFLKDVSDTLHEVIKEHEVDRILLAGSEDITAELQRLLPKAVLPRVVSRVRMPATARASEVLELALPVIERIDREQELAQVEDLLTMTQKTGSGVKKAVLGLNATLDAINQSRVYHLLYCTGMKAVGFRCAGCYVLLDQAPSDSKCPYCAGRLEQVPDVISHASERVLAMGGRSDEVRAPEAIRQLEAKGRIGAFLR